MTQYKVLGMMSGTSLDGLDLAYCHISREENGWQHQIKAHKSIPYTAEWRQRLKDSIQLPATELLRLHHEYGSWLGKRAREFASENGLEIDLIASHGHTSHHQPQAGYTFQLGYGQNVAHASGLRTVADFRSQDVVLGGQGAPLVPIGDRVFFGDYEFCLNLGGISNISFEKNGKRVAYDIGLANMVLNHIVGKIGMDYDKDGALARKGVLQKDLLTALNNLPYYSQPMPKSTGYEWFLEEVVPLIENNDYPVEDLLHTSVHHICQQVAIAIQQHAEKTSSRVLVTGGGAFNPFLTETLKEMLADLAEVVIPDRTLVEFKEALVFALMGAMRCEGEKNVLCSVTGAQKDSSSGVIYEP
ncbi:anhydro-N-acetylmuramic acid kinase [Zeaxanthinibacter enoshimensis]|uniref:Anhydro-N-acetylmuramic acid kinase n=1 Tax=Zeaxanthinibacter enoshimensis TaxID=392009 RepID=A0A4R6TJ71_9FLAO|nr:anhydro-N-acetylmuramic acid kinase [Zeaxanthinibacter enoshimensis]TDQ29350.1 anhydro-N-acetylmuramic acid kinase [Zeaxanthinibacter enoshimensis]